MRLRLSFAFLLTLALLFPAVRPLAGASACYEEHFTEMSPTRASTRGS